MKRVALLGASIIGFVATDAQAEEVVCHELDATGRGQDLGGGRTEARIAGDRLLRGSSSASFVITEVVGTRAAFFGVVLFDLHGGALALSVTGSFDVATGAFSAASNALTGFGRFRGVEGALQLQGLQDLATGTFDETISGELCLAR